jgi:hypothetical protein
MDEPAAAKPAPLQLALMRAAAAVDALSSSITGFALLAGGRAFMFIALLGWRDPMLGGAGLALLAVVGWLRWQCGPRAAPQAARCPCYNRSSCGGSRG